MFLLFPFFTKFLLLQIREILACQTARSRSLQNFYSCRSALFVSYNQVPVLYKISTLVDQHYLFPTTRFPFFTKFLLLQIFLDNRFRGGFPFFTKFLLLQIWYDAACSWRCSRSLQNFYSCRWREVGLCDLSFLFFTKFLLLQILTGEESDNDVPVLYKISTLVDPTSSFPSRTVPVLYKISTLVDFGTRARSASVPVLYKISTLVDLTRRFECFCLFPFFTKFLLLQMREILACQIAVPVLYKISTLVDKFARNAFPRGSRSLQNFYSCRFCKFLRARSPVPVLYKISTLVDSSPKLHNFLFPFFTKFLLLQMSLSRTSSTGSRSLQNFYSCRYSASSRSASGRSRSLQNFYSCRLSFRRMTMLVPVLYKISTLVDLALSVFRRRVPVLYKISTLVDVRSFFFGRLFPFFTKFLLLQITRAAITSASVPVLYKISTLVDPAITRRSRWCSRSLQNFYSCRSGGGVTVLAGSRSLQNFYSCRWGRAKRPLVRSRSLQNFYSCRSASVASPPPRSRSLQNFYSCRYDRAVRVDDVFPFFTKFLLLQIRRPTSRRSRSRSLQNFYSCRSI